MDKSLDIAHETVSHLPCMYLQISRYFLANGKEVCRRRHSKLLYGGIQIPCSLVFSCLSKVTIIERTLGEQELQMNTMVISYLLQEVLYEYQLCLREFQPWMFPR